MDNTMVVLTSMHAFADTSVHAARRLFVGCSEGIRWPPVSPVARSGFLTRLYLIRGTTTLPVDN